GGQSFEEFHEKVDSLHLFTPDLIKIKEVQDIISNQKIIKIVEAYLGAPPIISAVQAWWSTSNKISSEAASENAQMFHFDMERIKWLKFFVYINDVETENGPHSFVLGTHLSGSMPKILRKKGYARISDSEMGALFPPNRIKSFIGKAGTAILEDTRGYHKGTPPEKGTRLILQIEYCASLFGINSVCNVDNLILSKNMQRYISENASFLTNFKNSNALQEKI
ncbi:MAG: hypothetical protein KGQ54_03585, partial [Verrucomicrobia bacterium]|nr:hypothetical protein [Verrucomicrobiota bacterium]